MWTRDIDTGKWIRRQDLLPKENYDNLKVDLDRVKLYSKCLSGSTYIDINDFTNLYPQLDQKKIGFYFGVQPPSNGPSIIVDSTNQEEFYGKYLKEDAFTIKNLFTPEKLLEDQSDNFKYVDVATVGTFSFVKSKVITVDGVNLINGHRLLVKDQKTRITISSSIDPEDYFTSTLPVSSYTVSNIESTSITYEYFNEKNGIYIYDGNNLVREKDLSTYDDSYKLALNVKLGDVNGNKQFHLKRLKNGYYPVIGDNVEFEEKTNWVLRHRVDYNNIYDINYYDVKYFPSEVLYDRIDSKTFSIPERIISVGEFGVILNNQDQYSPSSTYSISNIISNKFKVNLRSIDDVKDYYWVCGDEGVLLKISKIYLTIEQIDLGEDLNFTSVSFYDDLYGMVVGKFNTIYFTRDGGWTWKKLIFDQFDQYSYNRVLHTGPNNAYIGGETGVFIELTYSNESWSSYNRAITKQLDVDDEYGLVEDINDIIKTNFVNINSFTFSDTNSSSNLVKSIVYTTKLNADNNLEVNIEHGASPTEFFYIFGSFSYPDSSIYINTQYDIATYSEININLSDLSHLDSKATFTLPTNTDGNILEGTYSLSFTIWENSTDQNFTRSITNFGTKTKSGTIIFIVANNELVIAYDLNRSINAIDNDFIYLSMDRSIKDAISISRRPGTSNMYLSADKIYTFNINEISNSISPTSNIASVTLGAVNDYFSNKIISLQDKIILCGNSSLNKFGTYSIISKDAFNFVDLDPTFNSRVKSRFLILDYDIGSKLNFFDDNRNYRLPDATTFDLKYFTQSGTTFSLASKTGEFSWMDYYADSEKTFIYNSSMQDATVVKFSNSFSYDPYTDTFTVSNIGNTIDDFKIGNNTLAPHFDGLTFSEFISSGDLATQFQTDKDLLIYKNLAIIKRSFVIEVPVDFSPIDYTNFSDKTKIGDVYKLSSDVVDTTLVVNNIRYFTYPNKNLAGTFTQSKPGLASANNQWEKMDAFLFCYSDFNENIINNLKKTTSPIYLTNLNRYKDQDDLVKNFNSHPYGIGYKLTKSSDSIQVSALFNEKTAYYNLQSRTQIGDQIKDMVYKESFLDFGFSPNYNILTYLNKINPEVFDKNKDFVTLPRLYNILGNDTQSATDDNLYIDSTRPSNYIRFGKNLYVEWRSLLINTFIDITIKSSLGSYKFEQYLITEKYYDTNEGAYFIKFNKKIDFPKGTGAAYFDLLSRSLLSQISNDLQLLNNIHRSTTYKFVQYPNYFTNFESSIKTKFSTESYLKALVCDYDIKKNISAILYNDVDFELSMNVLNVERELVYEIFGTNRDNNGKLIFWITDSTNEIKVGDLIFLELDGVNDTPMQGFQTVIGAGNFVTTSKDYIGGQLVSNGKIKVIKKDPFFNYQPVDLFRSGIDKKVTRSVEILPNNVILDGSIFSLENLDLNKYKLQFIDGLSLEEVSRFYHWILEAEVSNALIGKNDDGIVWYSGTWRCGRWFGGTWMSGVWLTGDWYGGTWNSFNVSSNFISAKVDKSYSDQRLSKWYNGRWFDGSWNNGIWYNGRRYAGSWNAGTWFNGIWNDGNWNDGFFRGGIWVEGYWNKGKFNCDSKPAFWINGTFNSGDFENGIWYNGLFGNNNQIRSRFGTRATNTRTATWNAGNWVNGDFHSFLTIDSNTNSPKVSEIHKFSIWKTGNWNSGNFYGGVVYNINFKNGVWYGGILEEIQVVGVDKIYDPINPSFVPTNKISINGIFRFNPGDEMWIIDDDRDKPYAALGSNSNPRKYRINRAIENETTGQTDVYLNYNLSTLNIGLTFAAASFSNVDIGVRVVSYFKDITWKSGLWTNGIFDGGNFESGIWYNGIFEGTWGI